MKPKLKFEELEQKILRYADKYNTLIEVATKLGVAYYGYRAFKHPAGALVGLISLKLAQAENEFSGYAGIAGLVSIGLANHPLVQSFRMPEVLTKEEIETRIPGFEPSELGEPRLRWF